MNSTTNSYLDGTIVTANLYEDLHASLRASREALTKYRVFFSYLTRPAPAERTSALLSRFLKVFTVIVCLAPVIECQTSPRRGVRRNAGGALERSFRSSLKKKKKKKKNIFPGVKNFVNEGCRAE
jgi:hypothetical protein